ncbi:MAG: ergothioneine biosynthesis protein EgtC [Gammaproteobacteria bacterium]|nr:ergothioneine biosynthesis protein EgtC [Gammaproteobacteria bacterium]
MCRLAAYIGKAIPLSKLLLDGEHSLYIQAWQPKELQYAKLNADGYGFGWYRADGRAAVYRNPMPIWSDANLNDLADSLYSERWLTMVRSATEGFATHIDNTQPFKHDRYLYLHNGYIKNFNQTLRQNIIAELSDPIIASLRGLNDSEYLFALLRQFIADHPRQELAVAIKHLTEWLTAHIKDGEALLNIIVSDNQCLYAIRHAINGRAPSLYYLNDADGLWVVSEKLDNEHAWQIFPKKKLMIARLQGDIQWLDL